MIIKFNKIQDLGDARYAASCMAEYIGFSMLGEEALPVGSIQEIIGWCAGPKVILEVSDSEIYTIDSWVNTLPIDGIECSIERLEELRNQFPDIQLWIIKENDDSRTLLNNNSTKLVTIRPSIESARNMNISAIQGISIDCVREVETGRKDYSDWNDFFEELEIF